MDAFNKLSDKLLKLDTAAVQFVPHKHRIDSQEVPLLFATATCLCETQTTIGNQVAHLEHVAAEYNFFLYPLIEATFQCFARQKFGTHMALTQYWRPQSGNEMRSTTR